MTFIPHPQKLAVTMALFCEYPNTALLLHAYVTSFERLPSFAPISFDLQSIRKAGLYNNSWIEGNGRNSPDQFGCLLLPPFRMHHGWASVRRTVALSLPYPEMTAQGKPIFEGEDCRFDRAVMNVHPVLYWDEVLGVYYKRTTKDEKEYDKDKGAWKAWAGRQHT